jgi:hypothetical protein
MIKLASSRDRGISSFANDVQDVDDGALRNSGCGCSFNCDAVTHVHQILGDVAVPGRLLALSFC